MWVIKKFHCIGKQYTIFKDMQVGGDNNIYTYYYHRDAFYHEFPKQVRRILDHSKFNESSFPIFIRFLK